MSTHKGHDHANTPGARAKCRRANSVERVIRPDAKIPLRAIDALADSPIFDDDDQEYLGGLGDAFDPDMQAYVQVEEFDPTISHPTYIAIDETHCELCGTFDLESLTTGDQGYTACCNEPTCDGSTPIAWAWTDHSEPITSTKRAGVIMSCCSARISLPHDMITVTHAS